MIFKYSKWVDEVTDKEEKSLDSLINLFGFLIVQTNGNVEEALEWLRDMQDKYGVMGEAMSIDEFIQNLKEQGLIDENGGVFSLTSKGGRRIRQDSLKEIFKTLRKSPGGQHETAFEGSGTERLSETKPFKFGDQPTNIDFTATIKNALKRDGVENFNLKEEDFEVYETEHTASCSTVLLIDISHSMILYGEDRITPAKRVAMALAELILTKYTKDDLHVVVFGDEAKEISVYEIPFITVGPFHTNTKEAIRLARSILKQKKNINKQIFMVTDGKPSAIFENGRLYKNPFGLDQKIVNKTLDEAVIARRERIAICTFMIARDPYLVDFVEKLTKANKGRAYYSSLDKLGEYIFVDYIRNRKKIVR